MTLPFTFSILAKVGLVFSKNQVGRNDADTKEMPHDRRNGEIHPFLFKTGRGFLYSGRYPKTCCSENSRGIYRRSLGSFGRIRKTYRGIEDRSKLLFLMLCGVCKNVLCSLNRRGRKTFSLGYCNFVTCFSIAILSGFRSFHSRLKVFTSHDVPPARICPLSPFQI